jgi:hypothetical protein
MLRPPPRSIGAASRYPTNPLDVKLKFQQYSHERERYDHLRRQLLFGAGMTTGAFNGSMCGPVFRDHFWLGYEIVKWDGDLGRPCAYQPLDDTLLESKIDLLREHYPSQRHRPWYDREAFLGLARIRGIECGVRYAEAFHVDKIAMDLSGP